ncbi:dihydrolipoyl dehydrogenase [Lutibacter sp.]|uniref:dihydrolipoyl dehydrogenase n=1 Tax=Lutibacter sp. TaxID=1925666 RepID=UPI0025BA92B5|nr:dihydrolipoyl dehydrogenase [Lutibacter sp.]MCF6181379.1 dihydrolipoyl dehydrogenase [Lutibacter sp.]
MKSFDIAIIGSGPGGYVAAIRCAQLGLKTSIIEKYNTLGGTCLNVGCIPSKALLDSSHHYFDAVKHFKTHGIEISELKVNFEQMITRKNEVVAQTSGGINYLMDKNKVTVFQGVGRFKDATHISIKKNDNSIEEIEAKNTIIATGSKPATLPFIQLDKKKIITSTEALNLKEIPKHLMVIGGGVIGLELGSVYNRLGSKVSIIEYMPTIIPEMDIMLAKELQKSLKKQGIKFYTSHKVTAVKNNGDEVVIIADDKKGNPLEFVGDYALISVGRKPYTKGLGLENIKIQVSDKGQIKTNQNLQTNIANIYAIGDVVKGAMLAHKAEEEGIMVAEIIAGQKPHIDYNLIPGVVYTWPEVATVGKTEEQLKTEGINYNTGTFAMRALGRARASMDIDGQIKVLADAKTDEILGVHMIGARAADMIAEAVIAMEFRASSEDIARSSHAHPTYTEAFKEACLDVANRAIHS